MFLLAPLLVSSALAQAPTWFGLRPSGPSVVQLIDLTDGAGVNSVIGTIPLGAGEVTWPDAMRCLPGFCLFTTTTSVSGSPQSFIYRVGSADASLQYKAACPGVCAHMHVDYTSGHAYTLSNTGPTWNVVECSGGAPVLVADVSAAVGGGSVAAGQTTHCSAFKSMYVGVNNGGGGRDIVFTVDLTAAKVVATVQLKQPLFDALWGTCDGSGVIGGVAFTPGAAGGNGTATFGTINGAGGYTPDSVVGVPAGFVPSGLLTGTSPANYKDAFVAAFYPPGTAANNTDTNGYLWAVDPYGGGSDDVVTEFGYYLVRVCARAVDNPRPSLPLSLTPLPPLPLSNRLALLGTAGAAER